MTNLTTVHLANAIVADAERRWLYGHPYRSDPRRRRTGRAGAVARLRTGSLGR